MSKYWIERQEKRENVSFNKGTKAYKEYVKSLEIARENIDSKIAKLYAKHSEDTGLIKAESMKIIQGKEYKEWRYKIEDYVKKLNSIKDKNSIEFKKLSLELETLASRSRINRLESLKADIDMELIKAGAEANNTLNNALTKTYTDTYKSLIDDLNYKNTIDSDMVKKIIGYDWSGANYSKRIWSNTESLAKVIKNELLVGINQGINYKTMSRRISEKFNTSKKNAERLVRTEINYVHNQATADSYKDAGVEKYQFLATLDSRTSDTCASLNGEIFEVKDMAVGINYPPMHPRCRSTTVPIIDYASLQNIKEDKNNILTNEEKSDIDKNILEMKRIIEENKVIQGKTFSDTTREKLAREILNSQGLKHVSVKIEKLKGSNGVCAFEIDDNNIFRVKSYILNKNDKRSKEYKIKTLLHELYHAKGDGLKTDYGIITKDRYVKTEETFTEITAHYMLKQIGIEKKLLPSYSDYLIENLPKLKRLDEFKDCVQIEDFGKIMYEYRFGSKKNNEWKEMSLKLHKVEVESKEEYFKKYANFIANNPKQIITMMAEADPKLEKYKDLLEKEIEKLGESNGEAKTLNKKAIFNSVLMSAMRFQGVM